MTLARRWPPPCRALQIATRKEAFTCASPFPSSQHSSTTARTWRLTPLSPPFPVGKPSRPARDRAATGAGAPEFLNMPKKMLIDAGHPEETRVVVLDGSRVEEFDFESQAKRQLRGNIYLARVTRVEPSLQAAFVEYG
ncbi:MAG: hypothetical protein MI723_02415, partial [Caulobacterales bacterium]|nr:hypothetical protein [Caulobacterales bacterium]